MKINKLRLLILFLTFSTTASFSQKSITGLKFNTGRGANQKPINYINSLKGGILIGASSYYGDLCHGMDCIKKHDFTIGASVNYRWTRHFATRAELLYLRLSGSDKFSPYSSRNLSFKSDNVEFSTVAIYDPFPYVKMYRRRHAVVPYLFGGVALLHYSPRSEHEGTWYRLRKIQTEGVHYSQFTLAIPFGLGLRYKAGPHLDVNFEAGFRYTLTDYLDDVSTRYPSEYTSELQEALSYRVIGDKRHDVRGNPTSLDTYFIFGVRAEYTLKVTRQHYNLHAKNAKLRNQKGLFRKN